MAKAIAKDAHKKNLIPTAEIENVTPEKADKLVSRGSYFWGINSKARAIRVRKLFGWNPTQKSLFNLLPDIVNREARNLRYTCCSCACGVYLG